MSCTAGGKYSSVDVADNLLPEVSNILFVGQFKAVWLLLPDF